ncbi:MAG: sulfotransferase [Polyangiaceae bacterium]|nr:sulfotransferase [Polyangiaceae bacterium]
MRRAGAPDAAVGEPRLPDFLIGGAPKCGTTSLTAALARHPGVFIPGKKELSFFHDAAFAKGLGWYMDQFRGAGRGQVAGEGTPDYLASEVAARRIALAAPGMRHVFLVRDPVARALSHYRFRFGTGRERRPLARVVRDELTRPDADDGYVLRFSRYAEGIQRYWDLFGPRRVHVVVFEELLASPAAELAAIQQFLGVPVVVDTLPRENASREARSQWALRAVQVVTRSQGPVKRTLRVLFPDAQRRQVRGWALRALTRRPARSVRLPDGAEALEAVLGGERAALERLLGRSIDTWRQLS